jgi:hypothetical protein
VIYSEKDSSKANGLIHFSHLSTKIGSEIKAVRPEGVFLFPNFGTQMALENE